MIREFKVLKELPVMKVLLALRGRRGPQEFKASLGFKAPQGQGESLGDEGPQDRLALLGPLARPGQEESREWLVLWDRVVLRGRWDLQGFVGSVACRARLMLVSSSKAIKY